MIINSVNIKNASFFEITNSLELLANKRLKVSLKRLGFIIRENDLLIPFSSNEKINVLQEIKTLLDSFGFDYQISQKLDSEEENYQREEELFEVFSKKASLIRNNQFHRNKEILDDLLIFRKTINDKLERRLYQLQELSAFHMAFTQNSCNFAVPGAGKTSIVYAAFAFLNSLTKNNKRHVDKLLVIGPLSSFKPWEDEYEACFGKKTTFQRLSGGVDLKTRKQHLHSVDPAQVTLIHHGGVDSVKDDLISFLKKHKTMIVVDEAHKIKNHVGQWGTSITDISKYAFSRVALSGTPVPNGYQDIYNIFKFIYPYRYRNIIGFNYRHLIELSGQVIENKDSIERLKNNLSPYFIRIKKDDLKLPPKIEHPAIVVEMDEIQREVYDFIFDKYLPDLKNYKSSKTNEILTKAKLIRLRQVITNPSLILNPIVESIEYFDNDKIDVLKNIDDITLNDSEIIHKLKYYSANCTPNKFKAALELLKNSILPQKAIIWTIFIQNATQLKIYLEKNGIKSELLIGSVTQETREDIVSKFNNPTNNEFSVVIANPFCVAESISLHKGCHNAIYLERDYNCANFLQSKDRIHRVGLSDNQITNYYYILSNHPHSIDNVIDKKLADKIKRMENIINDEIPLFSLVSDNNEIDLIEDLIKLHNANIT